MNQFVNQTQSLVVEAIDGLIKTSGGKLTRLDGYPHIKVVVRSDWDKSKVAIISGGGSGHEPAHAGFVGKGMLTAAICGEVFASPSVDAVLAGILSVTGEAGCLLIVKNYTGDRLNFGLAAEKARELGLKVAMVIVNDDVALPDLPQARGIAGTLFVHKITGALSEKDSDLKNIYSVAQKVISTTFSIGMSLDTCSIPGSLKEDRIADGNAELGLGIHGEAGAEQVELSSAQSAMKMVIERLLPFAKSDQLIVLLNNLGTTTTLEMSILANELVNSSLGQNIAMVIGPASMMTSLDMHGFSVSLLILSEENKRCLEYPTDLSSWPGIQSLKKSSLLDLPSGLNLVKYLPSFNDENRKVIERCCNVFIKAEKILNELDAKSGDGDTGSTLCKAAVSLKKSIYVMPLNDLSNLFRAIGQELSKSMGGSSGVILAIFFSASGDAYNNGKNLRDALIEGLKRIEEVGGAIKGDRTMIDALEPALEKLDRGISEAAKAARAGADKTSAIGQARAGRSAYVPVGNLLGNNDPGAEAVALLFEALVSIN